MTIYVATIQRAASIQKILFITNFRGLYLRATPGQERLLMVRLW